MSKTDKYIKYQCYTLSNNYHELTTGNYSLIKLIWLIAVRISMIGAFILGILIAFINHPVVNEFTLNIADYFGERFILGTMFSILMATGILVEYICLYHDRTGQLNFAWFIYCIRYNLVKYPLSDYMRKEISYKLSVIGLLNKVLLFALLSITYVVINILAILDLYRKCTMLKLVGAICFEIGDILCAVEMYGALCLGCPIVYVTTVYLKWKFLEIFNMIHLSILSRPAVSPRRSRCALSGQQCPGQR